METQGHQFKQVTSVRKKHHPAVPFLWEERPGTAKHNWKPNATTVPPLPPPVKLIVSVPFGWEELPGKPISGFSHPPGNNEQEILPPPPTAYSEDLIPLLLLEDHDVDYYRVRFETHQSFCPNKSTDTDSNQNAVSPSSPESECDESYAAGGGSLVGVSFLERLFPLLSSHQDGLKQNAGSSYSNSESSSVSTCVITKPQEEETADVRRRVYTLGELIMMSRRISRKRKAIHGQRQGLSMGMMEKGEGCFGDCMAGVWNWKKTHHFHRLKFM